MKCADILLNRSIRPKFYRRPCMLFYTKRIFFLTSLLGLLAPPSFGQATSASTNSPAERVEGYEFAFPALGTVVHLKAFSADKAVVEKAFLEAEKTTRRIESILTDYDSESETRRLTAAALAAPTRVSDDLWQVLHASERWFARSDGAFDSSLGTLTRLWRQSRRSQQLPSQGEIDAARKNSGWRHVELDPSMQTVKLKREGIQFDFGAIGKGYIVDRIFDGLIEHGVPVCLVNISGNMRCGEAPPRRDGWRIAISPLEKDQQPLRQIALTNSAIATSGDLWQYVVVDGVRRSHILDPRTGLGVPGPIAATAIAETAMDADALATAACVKGPARALELAECLPDCELLIATKTAEEDVEVSETPGFPKSDK